jgi:hypothetical protein
MKKMAEMGSILTSTSSSKKQDAQQTNTGILVVSRPSVYAFDKDGGAAAEANHLAADLEQVSLSSPPQTHPSQVEKTLEQLMTTNPDLVKKFLAKIPPPISPTKGADED